MGGGQVHFAGAGGGNAVFFILDDSKLLESESEVSASVIRGVTVVKMCLTAVKALLTGVKTLATDVLFFPMLLAIYFVWARPSFLTFITCISVLAL